jgi:transposase
LDNASIHHGGNIEDLCAEMGVRIVYLPPYSPDFNPIEKAFAVIKDRLRRSQILPTAADAEEEMEMIYTTALTVITPGLVVNLYHGSIYP